MVGLTNISARNLQEIIFLFEGGAEELNWSPDGNYLAMTITGGSGLKQVSIVRIKTGQPLEHIDRLIHDKFFIANFETLHPSWSDTNTVTFTAKSVKDSQTDSMWSIRIDRPELKEVNF